LSLFHFADDPATAFDLLTEGLVMYVQPETPDVPAVATSPHTPAPPGGAVSWQLTSAPGIELRQLEPRDADALFRAVERNRGYLREWLPWVDQTVSTRELLLFFERGAQQLLVGRGRQPA